MVLKTCKDRVCTHPWESLHANGEVGTLVQALDERFDTFYAKQPRMWFAGCPLGYWADWESQEAISSYQSEQDAGLQVQGDEFDFATHWHWLT